LQGYHGSSITKRLHYFKQEFLYNGVIFDSIIRDPVNRRELWNSIKCHFKLNIIMVNSLFMGFKTLLFLLALTFPDFSSQIESRQSAATKRKLPPPSCTVTSQDQVIT